MNKQSLSTLNKMVAIYKNSHKVKEYSELEPSFGCGCELIRFSLIYVLITILGGLITLALIKGDFNIAIVASIVVAGLLTFAVLDEATKEGYSLFKMYLKKYISLPFLERKKKSNLSKMAVLNSHIKRDFQDLKVQFSGVENPDFLNELIEELSYPGESKTSMKKVDEMYTDLRVKKPKKLVQPQLEAPVTVKELESLAESSENVKFFTAN